MNTNNPALTRTLTETDKALLSSYAYKCQQVKAFTLASLRGTHTGMLLFGAGGNGKSYSIRETLKEQKIQEITSQDVQALKAAAEMDDSEDLDDDGEFDTSKPLPKFGHNTWLLHQGRITPKGLVQQMAQFPKSIHVIEDAETMFDDKNAWGVLRMALHSQDHSLHSSRRITWVVSGDKGSFDFEFSGALIIVGNRLLKEGMDEIEAVKTRCPSLNFDISNAELVAKMKEICLRGYTDIPAAPLTKDECFGVLEFMLTEIENDPTLKNNNQGKEKKLNLRLLISGFRFMALGKMEPSINWQEMLLSQMKQQVGAGKRRRSERIHDEKQAAQELTAKKWPTQKAKLVEWCKMTGRDTTWADSPEESPEYKKGFNSAKTDLARKLK